MVHFFSGFNRAGPSDTGVFNESDNMPDSSVEEVVQPLVRLNGDDPGGPGLSEEHSRHHPVAMIYRDRSITRPMMDAEFPHDLADK